VDVTLGGTETNLRKLENKLIRAVFQDAHVHAALNCASLGCPRLPREAFVGERLEAQLEAAMREFLADDRQVAVSDEERTVTLSKIFDWFRGDFIDDERRSGNADPNLIDYVNRFRESDARIPRDYRVAFAPYDKRINKQ
jgi:hypothetical protein